MLEKFYKNYFVDSHLHLAQCAGFEKINPFPFENYSCLTCFHSAEEWAAFEKIEKQVLPDSNEKSASLTEAFSVDIVSGENAKNPDIKKAFGLHPQNPDMKNAEFLERLLSEKKICAIGEAGFDFFTEEFKNRREEQKTAFEAQLSLASYYKVPVVLHIRKAFSEVFAYKTVLKNLPSVIFHGFPMGLYEAESVLKSGINAYFSFGKVLFRGGRKALDCVKNLSLDRLLLETDAPYMTLKDEEYTSFTDIAKVYDFAWSVRKAATPSERLSEEDFCARLKKNFYTCFGLPLN